MSKKICLTGVKPTGMVHLGNYLGAIKPPLSSQILANMMAISLLLIITLLPVFMTLRN